MKCSVVQDLLPLYAENLTSQDSNEEIISHLRICKTCSEFYQNMKSQENIFCIPKQDIQPLKKVRRSGIVKAILGFLTGAVVLTGIFLFVFWGIIPAKQEDIQVSYTVGRLEDDSYYINFDFSAVGNWTLESRNETAKNEFFQKEITLYCVKNLPFDNRGTCDFSYGFSKPRPFSEEDIFIIHYRDEDIIYSLKEIAEKTGLQ